MNISRVRQIGVIFNGCVFLWNFISYLTYKNLFHLLLTPLNAIPIVALLYFEWKDQKLVPW